MLTNRERIERVFRFEPVDRLPVIEWAAWWDKTIARWRHEGLPAELTDAFAIREHLGLDALQQLWVGAIGPGVPGSASHGAPIVSTPDEYRAIRPKLYPNPSPLPRETLRAWAAAQETGDLVFWLTLEGAFWFPRTLLGIEGHLYAFYDLPELMHEIIDDLLAYNLRLLHDVAELGAPLFMTIAEDMSYNHGPMLSREQFDEYLAPFYRALTPVARELGIRVLVDSDGDIAPLVPWLEEVGVEGLLPLERMAGVDVNRLRAEHPRFLMVGAFDKTVMHLGEQRMRQEFERLLPVMRSGGYIPACDHQTPPEVALDDYRLYLRLLNEYASRAAL